VQCTLCALHTVCNLAGRLRTARCAPHISARKPSAAPVCLQPGGRPRAPAASRPKKGPLPSGLLGGASGLLLGSSRALLGAPASRAAAPMMKLGPEEAAAAAEGRRN